MSGLKYIAFVLVLGSLFWPVPTVSQPSARPANALETLNKEAQSNDPEEIHKYCATLIQGLVGNSAGPAYERSVIDRLARAESMARNGNKKLVSEAEIAQVFNQLMKDTGSSDSYRADLAVTEELRGEFAKILPALFTREKNGSYCNPGEAVYLLELLIQNVARPRTPIPVSAPKMEVGTVFAPVREHLELFYVKHPQSEVTKVFDHLFKFFQI